MARKSLFIIFLGVFFFGLVSPIFALDKVKLGASTKITPNFYLPPLTAEERGFWKENGLEVEWLPFAGTVPHMRAIAAGAVDMGLVASGDVIHGVARGLPATLVMELIPGTPFFLWVRTDSPYRNPMDLKGKRIAVTGLGAYTHALGRVIFKAHGIEKDVRFIGAGGVAEMMAGLRAGVFDAMVNSVYASTGLKVEGIVREFAPATDYLPQPWMEYGIHARKDFARSKPELVKKMIRATLQSIDFMRKNPRWTVDRMKTEGISEGAAKLLYDYLKVNYTTTGRMDQKALENVRKVFIDYGIITEKPPALEEVFTNEHLPG